MHDAVDTRVCAGQHARLTTTQQRWQSVKDIQCVLQGALGQGCAVGKDRAGHVYRSRYGDFRGCTGAYDRYSKTPAMVLSESVFVGQLICVSQCGLHPSKCRLPRTMSHPCTHSICLNHLMLVSRSSAQQLGGTAQLARTRSSAAATFTTMLWCAAFATECH